MSYGASLPGPGMPAGRRDIEAISPGTRKRLRAFLLMATLIAYIAAVIFLPRIGEHLRAEDAITPLLGVAGIFGLLRSWGKHRDAILFGCLYFLYLFVLTLVNVIVEKIPLEALIIYGKELQYFFGFLVLLAVVRDPVHLSWVKKMLGLGVIFGAITGVGLFFSGQRGYYGIAYITEPFSPSLSAVMYFNLAVVALMMRATSPSALFRKACLWLSIVLFCLLAIVGSRTGMAMGMTFLLLMFVWSRRSPLLWTAILAMIVGSLIVIFYSQIQVFGQFVSVIDEREASAAQIALRRTGSLITKPGETVENSRFEAWGNLYRWATESFQNTVFGCGRGCSNVYRIPGKGTYALGLSGDSQYLVNFLEMGLLGLTLWAWVFIAIVRAVQGKHRKIYVAYLIACMAGGIFFELFMLSKGGAMFWLVSGLAIAGFRGKYDPPTEWARRRQGAAGRRNSQPVGGSPA